VVKKNGFGPLHEGRIGGYWSFWRLYASPGKDKVLVASMDGVGTQAESGCPGALTHTGGVSDIVNHCVNDILVLLARNLCFFSDISARPNSKRGCLSRGGRFGARPARRDGCALLGGGKRLRCGLYPKGEYDLVGTLVGMVDVNG